MLELLVHILVLCMGKLKLLRGNFCSRQHNSDSTSARLLVKNEILERTIVGDECVHFLEAVDRHLPSLYIGKKSGGGASQPGLRGLCRIYFYCVGRLEIVFCAVAAEGQELGTVMDFVCLAILLDSKAPDRLGTSQTHPTSDSGAVYSHVVISRNLGAH